MTKRDLNSSQKQLLLLSSLVVISWFVPYLHWLTLPLQYLYTHLHELGHAIAALLTGGQQIVIRVFADGSGETVSLGGVQILVSPAGYIGSTLMGALVLAFSGTRHGARNAAIGLLTLMIIGLAFWIRGDLVGLLSAIVIIAMFAFLARTNNETGQKLVQFIGLFLCVTSLQSVLQTLHFSRVAQIENDAQILEQATGIPAILSATLWAGISIGVAWWGLRRAWSAR
ncbi:MAG: M50 family metallopeptidase [Fimbriimonadaceae bacterium]